MRTRTSNRMPPVGSKHVVTIHAVARMLGWTAARIRRIDDVLRPTRAGTANGERLYDVDRVLFLVETMDSAPPVPTPIVISAAEYKELRQRWRAERRGTRAPRLSRATRS